MLTTRRIPRNFLVALVVGVLVATAGVVSVGPAEAASYGLKASVKYSAVRLTWKSQGAGKTYQVQYGTSSGFSRAKIATTTDTSFVANRLGSGKTYYFRVRVRGASAWSPKVSKKTSYPKTFDNNAVEKAIKLSADNVTKSSIYLTWSTKSGQYACFRVSVSPSPSSGQPDIQCTTSFTVTGLARSTRYQIKLYTVAPASGVWPAVDISGASSTLTKTTSNYTLDSPDDLSLVLPQRTNQATLSWTAPDAGGLGADDWYQVILASNSAMTKDVIKYGTKTHDTKLTVTGISSNHAYYARIVVVTGANVQRSDKSDYLMVKTLHQYGTITGSVSTSAPHGSLIAVAYDGSGEVGGQSDVAADGSYQIRAYPGTYKVRISYIGRANYYSSWVNSGSTLAVTSSSATKYSVANEMTTSLPATTIGAGNTLSGTVLDARTKRGVSGATISIRIWNGSRFETLATTYSQGTFGFSGIPRGVYVLRATYIGSSTYKATNRDVTVNGDTSATIYLNRK